MSGATRHSWVRFSSKDEPLGDRVTRYRIDAVQHIVGRELAFAPGDSLTRCEGPTPFGAEPGDLVALVQHLGYTDAPRRRELAAASAPEGGPLAVLIPISKSPEWWALAQDERLALLRQTGSARGHMDIGADYASVIFRKLYHSRYLPHSHWDFLTYFEFPQEHAAAFRQLLRALRNVELNPEWRFVEHETEIWLTKVHTH